mmetsp:Transcript_29940/g.49693  ORF Transcript_29940/g.49693 Transcript_29940/m.49693 type:complete len:220 (-) Transcript_29940:389-1048(-)
MNVQSHGLDLLGEGVVSTLIDLTTHENVGKFDNVRSNAHVLDGLGGFQSQQSTTNYGGTLDVVFLGIGEHAFQIFNGPVDKDTRSLFSRNGWDKGKGSRGEDAGIVGDGLAGGSRDGLGLRVNGDGLVSQIQFDVVVLVPCRTTFGIEFGRHTEIGWIAGFKVGREFDPIVGGARFFAKGTQLDVVLGSVQQVFHEPLSDHAIANHHDAFLLGVEGCGG